METIFNQTISFYLVVTNSFVSKQHILSINKALNKNLAITNRINTIMKPIYLCIFGYQNIIL